MNRSPLEKVTVTAGPILPPPSTRVTTEREGQVMHFNWEKDDAILLANTKQQLPYLATQAGASTQFLSALTGSDNVADYINGVVDKGEIYAYYPYNAGERIDMATKCVAISQDEPFLYAVDTIKNEAINLHFYHAFAYLKLNVSMVGEEMQDKLRLGIAPDYHPMTLIGPSFNFATNQVEYTDYKDEMELTAEQLADTEHLYPILPARGGGYFRLSCQVGDTINGDTPKSIRLMFRKVDCKQVVCTKSICSSMRFMTSWFNSIKRLTAINGRTIPIGYQVSRLANGMVSRRMIKVISPKSI